MISFLQNILKKHSTWLFTLLLIIIVIPFVFTIGASPGIGTSKKAGNGSTYFGYDLNNDKDMNRLFQEAYISFILKTGTPPYHPMMIQQEALSRPAMLDLANKLEIPEPKEDQVVAYIKTCKMFQNEDGFFDQRTYDKFVKDLDDHNLMDKESVARIIAQNIRIQHVEAALEGPGYTLPSEAIDFLKKLRTKWDFVQAELRMKGFNPTIEVKEADLKAFYDGSKEMFKVPPRVKVSYVEFNNDAFVAQIDHPSEKQLEQFYNDNQPLFRPDPERSVGEQTIPEFDAIKDDVYSAYMNLNARELAEKAANDFAYRLYEDKAALNSEAFKKLLEDNKVGLKTLKPYPANRLPKSDIPAELLRRAFALDAEHFYTDAASSDSATYIVFFEKIIPEKILPFEKVRSRLVKRFEETKKRELFEQKAENVAKKLKEAVAKGEDFISVAKSEGLEIRETKDYTIEDKDKRIPFPVMNALSTLKKGQVSSTINVPQGILLLYLKDKDIPSIDMKDPEVKKAEARIGTYTAKASAQGMISELIQAAFKKAQPQQPQKK